MRYNYYETLHEIEIRRRRRLWQVFHYNCDEMAQLKYVEK